MKGIFISILKLGVLVNLFYFPVSNICMAQKQTAKYNIRAFGMDIGELNVEQQINGHDTIVKAITNIDFRFIFTYKGNYLQEGYYHNSDLRNSHLRTIRKGKVNSDTHIIKNKDSYMLIKNGDTSCIHNKIRYSGSLVYFNEPKNISTIVYEMDGERKNIEAVGKHTYHIFSQNKSKKNDYEYVYESGILKRAIIKYPLAVIYLERK